MKTKQEQIEEIQKIIDDSWEFSSISAELGSGDGDINVEEAAKALYDAGYRKTFTSELASDTQKAFKEGYEKGCETCEQAWDNGYNDGYESGKEDGVKEFAEKVKGKSEMFLVAKGDGVYGEKPYVSIEKINELLKEYKK